MPVGLVWPGVGAVFAREMGVPGGECWGSCRSVLARGVRILLRGTTHPAAPASQPSSLGLPARSARGRAACRSPAAISEVVRLSSARLLVRLSANFVGRATNCVRTGTSVSDPAWFLNGENAIVTGLGLRILVNLAK